MTGKTIGILILIMIVGIASGVTAAYFITPSGEEELGEGAPNYEAIATVSWVKDGDTISVTITDVIDPHEGVEESSDTIRLAGIDTVESGEEGYTEATNFTDNLTPSGETVYLDIDDQAYGKGPYRGYYGRLIAVVYVKVNDQWVNVNAEALRWGQPLGYCEMTYYTSEFNPSTWLEEDYPYIRS